MVAKAQTQTGLAAEPGGGVGGVGVSDRGSRGGDLGHDCRGGVGGGGCEDKDPAVSQLSDVVVV